MLITGQFCWVGHILRMDDSRIPKQLFFGQLSTAVPGALDTPLPPPFLRYKDTLKNNLKSCKMDLGIWQALAQDRSAWRTTCQKAVHTFQENRVVELQERCARRMAYASLPLPTLEHMFTICGCACKSKIGQASHKRRNQPGNTTTD